MKPRIVLYNPKSNASGKRILPMSLLALGAVLEDHYDYSVVDGNVSADPLNALRARVREGAEILGVTVMPGPQLAEAFPHCRSLKAEFPSLTVVWGGYFPTQHASACLSSAAVDFVVRGHGELVFRELLDRLENPENLRDLPGLAYKNADGKAVENQPSPIPNPEELPPYPYHRVDMPEYIRRTFLGSRTLPHHSSYGCPFSCNFCAVVNMVQGRWLAQSVEQLVQIAEMYVARWQVNAIEFHDNNFFTREARVAGFAERVARLQIAWWGEARIDTLLKFSEETWRLMRDSGLKMVYMGAESASDGALQMMEKGGSLTPEKTLEMAAKAREYGIVPEFSFMVGIPPDPEADAVASEELIRRIKKANPASEIIIYMYTPVPLRGELYDAARADGFSFPETLEDWVGAGWMEFAGRRHSGLNHVHEKLRTRMRNFERVMNAYFPTVTDLKLKGFHRAVLRGASALRYHARIYGLPLELRLLQRIFHYQRPETAGF